MKHFKKSLISFLLPGKMNKSNKIGINIISLGYKSMSYSQKIVTILTGKKPALLLTAGLLTLTCIAQDNAKFSGEWKLNVSKSEINLFPLCIFGGGDRMRSKTMKIARHADFLTVDVASEAIDGALVTRQEKLTFDGKESEATFVGRPREKSAARWSDDGQAITVTSVKSFDTNGEKADFKVTEVWKLINDGKSISVQVNSSSGSREDIMKLVYDKQWAVDYRF